MKLIYLLLILSEIIYAQNNRYTDSLFSAEQTTTNGIYAEAPELLTPYLGESYTEQVNLKFHLFQPLGDTLAKRPLIIFAHGGGFISGEKENDDMMEFCRLYACKGYVTATIQYRLGMNVTSSASATRAVYRAIQDGRAAVSYFKENAATYGIDTNYVYFVGSSAGAFIGLHILYMNEESERPSATFAISHFPPTPDDGPDLGKLDAIEPFKNCIAQPNAIVSLWGALQDTTLINRQDTISNVFLVHGTADQIVPFEVGSPFNLPSFPATYGSYPISKRLKHLHFTDNKTYFVTGKGHEFYGVLNGMWAPAPNEYWDSINVRITDFLWQQHKPHAAFTWDNVDSTVHFNDKSDNAIKWFWNFGDGTESEEENPQHAYSENGIYLVSLKVLSEINSWDTVSAYVQAFPDDVNSIQIATDFSLSQNYPNPFSKGADGNPTTTIKYSIPKIRGIKTLHTTSLHVYNILGEEIATLVNKRQAPGNYSVKFNASNLPSGIYFYRLQIGKTSLTRKMILMK